MLIGAAFKFFCTKLAIRKRFGTILRHSFDQPLSLSFAFCRNINRLDLQILFIPFRYKTCFWFEADKTLVER